MNFENAVETILETDAALVAEATGGIHELSDLGKLGLNRTQHPGSFTNGIIKPTIVIRQRSNTPTFDIMDEGNQLVSARAVVEVWFYQSSGYSTIRSMRSKVFTLLHDKRVSTGRAMWNWEVLMERDTNLDASVERVDYEIFYLMKPS